MNVEARQDLMAVPCLAQQVGTALALLKNADRHTTTDAWFQSEEGSVTLR